MLPLPAQSMNQMLVELRGLTCDQDLEGLSTPHTSSQLEHTCAASDPPQSTKDCHSSPGIPVHLAAPCPRDQAAWQESSAMELDFLPDSQIQDALDATNMEQIPCGNLGPGDLQDAGCNRHSARPRGGALRSEPADYEYPPGPGGLQAQEDQVSALPDKGVGEPS